MGLVATGLEKRFRRDGPGVLQDVSFAVPTGTLAAVLGSSGAGKSTLLRCLVGLERLDAGTLEVGGVVVQGALERPHLDPAVLKALHGKVGMVFQSFELFPHLTVLENCVLAPRLVKGWTAAAAAQEAREHLGRLGVLSKEAEFPDSLSGGQKQRVAIARALSMGPEVLLYDEPTSALDPSLKQEVRRTLQEVRADGVTQVLVTHDLALARDTAELVFVLDAGHIVEEGPVGQVLGNPQHPVTRKLVHSAGAWGAAAEA